MVTDLMGSLITCRNGWALLLLCASSPVALAQVLTDPTRPPAEINAPAVLDGQAVIQEGNRLQSIIISPIRSAAIISGQTVELGAKHGDARLVEVKESSVILQGPQGRQVLALFPGVEMKSTVLLPKENKAKKKKLLKKPASRAGKEERK